VLKKLIEMTKLQEKVQKLEDLLKEKDEALVNRARVRRNSMAAQN